MYFDEEDEEGAAHAVPTVAGSEAARAASGAAAPAVDKSKPDTSTNEPPDVDPSDPAFLMNKLKLSSGALDVPVTQASKTENPLLKKLMEIFYLIQKTRPANPHLAPVTRPGRIFNYGY
jgi:hypothetical protein